MKIFDYTGKTIGDWYFIEKINSSGTSKYLCKCISGCGKEKIISSQKIYRDSKCAECESKKNFSLHLDKKHGKLTCVGFTEANPHRRLIVSCECGMKYKMKTNQFSRTSCCHKCRNGFIPGMILNGVTLLERIKGTLWKMQCHCGKIIEKRASLSKNRLATCGCDYKNKLLHEAEKKIGKKHGFLTVKKVLKNEKGRIRLLIKCKCKKTFEVDNGHEFKNYSCGCYKPISLPKGEKAFKATLKNCEVISMREFYKKNIYSIEELAEMFKKSKHYINRIVKYKIWKHVI